MKLKIFGVRFSDSDRRGQILRPGYHKYDTKIKIKRLRD